jgi:hypothetical protein
MHVRHNSSPVFLVKTREYSRDSDTPFDVGPYPDKYTPPFLRELDPFHDPSRREPAQAEKGDKSPFYSLNA